MWFADVAEKGMESERGAASGKTAEKPAKAGFLRNWGGEGIVIARQSGGLGGS